MAYITKFTSKQADIHKQLDEVKDLVMDNINKVAERQNGLNDIDNDAMMLADTAGEFYNSTEDLKKQMMCCCLRCCYKAKRAQK